MLHTVPYGPTPVFPLNLLPLDIHSREVLLAIAIMQEKQQNNILEIKWVILVDIG